MLIDNDHQFIVCNTLITKSGLTPHVKQLVFLYYLSQFHPQCCHLHENTLDNYYIKHTYIPLDEAVSCCLSGSFIKSPDILHRTLPDAA